MQIEIEKLVYGGDALARPEGLVALVPFALPQEHVIVQTETTAKNLTRCKVTSVVSASPHRVEAPCPYFGTCGGCHYQHADYAYQLEQKKEILRDVFRRVGRLEAPAEIESITGPEWNYRNRIQLHYDGKRLGYYRAGSHDVIEVEKCPISSPRLNQAIETLQGLRRQRRWPEFLRSLELFTNEDRVQVNVTDSGPRHLSRTFFEWLNGVLPGALDSALEYEGFRVSHRSFFQVNRFLLNPLVDAALSQAGEGKRALDLYAGVGLFSRQLAERFETAIAVEAVNSAVADLKVNAPKAAAVRATVEEYLAGIDFKPDFVLADPPRAGLGAKVTTALNEMRAPRLTIVSCDPATLARDLSALRSSYRIKALTLIDLFPQTASIETVTHLEPAE